MEKVTAWETVERLRLELECLGISHREIERRVGRSFRQNLAEGKEDQLAYSELLECLEAAGIEQQGFFARLFGIGNPLSFDLLRPKEEKVGRRARACVSWSRFCAHFAAGHLRSDDQAAFESSIAETKAVLDVRDQVSATLDLIPFLQAIGKCGQAQSYLEAELWNTLDLDDIDVQRKYIGLWSRLGLPHDSRLGTLVNRRELKLSRPQPKLKLQADPTLWNLLVGLLGIRPGSETSLSY